MNQSPDDLAKALRRSSKAAHWPKESPDHAITPMVARGKRSGGKHKAAKKK